MRRLFVAAALGLSAVLLPLPARAADPDGAKQHFEAGKKLREENDCVHAIGEFEKSLAADKSIGAYYNLGYCYEQLQKRNEAYDAYRHARDMASTKKDDRLREISGALGALLETPHIRLILPQLPEGIRITVDGQLVPPDLYGTETIVFTQDAKSHQVVVTAPGYAERRDAVDQKDPRSIELKPPVTIDSVQQPPPVEEERGDRWNAQHWVGLGTAVVGLTFLTIGSVIFVKYNIDRSNLDEPRQAAAKKFNTTKDPADRAAAVALDGPYQHNERDFNAKLPFVLTATIGGTLATATGFVLFFTAFKSRPNPASAAPGNQMRLLPSFDGQKLYLTGSF